MKSRASLRAIFANDVMIGYGDGCGWGGDKIDRLSQFPRGLSSGVEDMDMYTEYE